MQLFKTPNIPFLKYKFAALALTAVIVLAGLINIIFFNGLKLGVDFGEGTLLRIMFREATDVGEVRQMLKNIGLAGSPIQETGKNGREFQIRAIPTINIKGGEQEQMEAHASLADSIINAIRGEEASSAEARGLKDLNLIDEKTLTALLETSFPGTGAESSRKIIANRIEKGIITSWQEIESLGVKASVISFLQEKSYLGKIAILSRETVGPQVGKDLRRRALQAIIWSLIGMLIYIAVRFKLEYGVAAIFTLTQDVLITLSIYSFTNREINLPIIAGFLTIVGFSINDTIVIFDRIRENQKLFRKSSLEEIMNISLNQTLGRTVITSGTVLLTVLALFIFGGEVINDFAFLMLVGTIEGVYSTISLSCPAVLFWKKIFPSKKR